MTDKSALGYLAKVKRALPRDEQRARHMAQATALAENYIEENPNVQGADLEAAFGAPADFAAAMVGEQGVAQAKRQRNRRLLGICLAVVAVALTLALFWFLRWKAAQDVLRGDFWVEESVQTLTPEEFDAIWDDPNVIKDGERLE